MSTVRLFIRFCSAAAILFAAAGRQASAELNVATMHPVLTGVAQQIGGSLVKVTAIVPPGADVHYFSPTPADVKKLAGVQLVLIAGKHIEDKYLGELRSNLTAGQQIVEVSHDIQSLVIEPGDATFMCCPEHAKGAIDPHWWNSVDNMHLAGRCISEAFSAADPAHKDAYKANAAAWDQRMTELKKWAKKEINAIPPERRKIATAHLSLSYFAKEFGFKLLPVQGLNHDTNATAQELAAAIKVVRDQKITAIFPEQGVNPKYLKQLAAETGVKIAGELIADGNGTGDHSTFEAAFKYNVETIVAALKP